jgi:hypothetical protein
MAQINRPDAYKVIVLEYERGWGSKVDDTLYFDNETEAREYVRKFNERNYDDEVPDWYMIAEYCGKV